MSANIPHMTNKRLRHAARRLHSNQRATSMTEFVMFLPVFVLIFVGIFELGRLYDSSLRARGMAFTDTISRFRQVQDTSFRDALTSNGVARKAISPVLASADATSQLFRSPPNQRAGVREVLAQRELNAFSQTSGLGQHGSLGEALGRINLARQTGVELTAVDHIITHDLTRFVGPSALADELFDDRPHNAFSTSMSGQGNSLLQTLANKLNETITSAGARSALAANIRYGTLTGSFENEVHIASLGDVEVSAWYSVLAPTYTHSDDRKNGQLATFASRLTFEANNQEPYRDILAFGRTPGLPILPDEYEVPNPADEDLQGFFELPLNYGDSFYNP
ncbi:pilus assembly protein [Lujinxingia sediminis]|uniref:Pilus assembly protein n=1 Tax=Lujinxingia sediminis TaxID=2480984 RepID=A0ABY0CP93_9DELT|nr:pilus assembly protein [Lujinxingia sediminis]